MAEERAEARRTRADGRRKERQFRVWVIRATGRGREGEHAT